MSPSIGPLPKLWGLARGRSTLGERLLITAENHFELRNLAPSSVLDRCRALLRMIARRRPLLGSLDVLNPHKDYPLGYCESTAEFISMLDAIKQLRWVVQGSEFVHDHN
jgi:hypothetical protein